MGGVSNGTDPELHPDHDGHYYSQFNISHGN